MRLVALEFLERLEVGVRVAQPDDQSDRDLMVLEVVHEAAAVRRVVERPAGAVQHEPRHVLRRIDLPQFLDADAPGLRIAALVEPVPRDHLLAEMAARAFGEQRVLAEELHAGLEVGGRLAVLADTHVARRHAAHRAVLVVQHFGAGKAGEDLDAQLFGLLSRASARRWRG